MSTSKIIQTTDSLLSYLSKFPRSLVFTNGVFDILHVGHIRYLQAAKELGATLIIAINTDRSVQLLGKGDDRPINSEQDRAELLAALSCVDLITFFNEKTPVRLLCEIKPDIYVKGGDYDMEQLEETRCIRSWGGESVALDFTAGKSTSNLIKKIREPS
jgi:rfaE bifunctional protein nucleotidyltransferase chain/domain